MEKIVYNNSLNLVAGCLLFVPLAMSRAMLVHTDEIRVLEPDDFSVYGKLLDRIYFPAP